MKIEEITKTTDVSQVIKVIQETKDSKHEENLKKLKSEWDVKAHRVMVDKDFLPDKDIKDAKGNILSKKEVNRIGIPYQKMIVNRIVAFGFVNDVQILDNAEEDASLSAITDAVKRVLFENKESSFNRKVARDLYRAKETAEIWYFQKGETDHENYGFKTPYKIKCMQLSPWQNNTLYPIFNEYEDLSAFARQYVVKFEGKDKVVMDVYTDTEARRFAKIGSGWTEEQIEKNGLEALGKIPIIYGSQDKAEWEDVEPSIQRLELLLSKHAEINDYHASPKTFVKGELKSVPVAGEANPILKGGIDSDMKILSWQHAPESVKLEIETLLENIHKFTQTPDISFKSIKGLSQVSGVMLKMLFMDAHLKVMDKNEIWDEYFTRRYNLIKSMLGLINPQWKDKVGQLELTPLIKPFIIDDEKAMVETLMTANGNKPVMSHRTSVQLAGFTDDTNAEFEEILKDSEVDFIQESSNPIQDNEIPEEV